MSLLQNYQANMTRSSYEDVGKWISVFLKWKKIVQEFWTRFSFSVSPRKVFPMLYSSSLKISSRHGSEFFVKRLNQIVVHHNVLMFIFCASWNCRKLQNKIVWFSHIASIFASNLIWSVQWLILSSIFPSSNRFFLFYWRRQMFHNLHR